jgi:hypothetical protein
LTGERVPRVVVSVYLLSGLAAGVLIAGWLAAAPANLATGCERRNGALTLASGDLVAPQTDRPGKVAQCHEDRQHDEINELRRQSEHEVVGMVQIPSAARQFISVAAW